jgi:hypothetical protein
MRVIVKHLTHATPFNGRATKWLPAALLNSAKLSRNPERNHRTKHTTMDLEYEVDERRRVRREIASRIRFGR